MHFHHLPNAPKPSSPAFPITRTEALRVHTQKQEPAMLPPMKPSPSLVLGAVLPFAAPPPFALLTPRGVVDRPGEPPGHARVTYTAPTGTQIVVPNAPRCQRSRERTHNMILPDNLGKCSAAIFSIQCQIGHSHLPSVQTLIISDRQLR